MCLQDLQMMARTEARTVSIGGVGPVFPANPRRLRLIVCCTNQQLALSSDTSRGTGVNQQFSAGWVDAVTPATKWETYVFTLEEYGSALLGAIAVVAFGGGGNAGVTEVSSLPDLDRMIQGNGGK